MYRIKGNKTKQASVTLEAALAVSVLISVFLLLYGLLESFLLYNCVSKAVYETASFASSYGLLYHEKGIGRLGHSIQNQLSEKLNLGPVLSKYINAPSVLTYGDDFVYSKAAEEIFENRLKQQSVYKRFFSGRVEWSLEDSRFFNGNDEFLIRGSFSCSYHIPLMERFLKGFTFQKSVKGRAFIEGTTPDIALDKKEDLSIWKLSNFERGQKLQERYGRNLPRFFPVIDYFKDGTAGMIRSINHTLKSYQEENAFRQTLEDLFDELLQFNGASYGNAAVEDSDIQKRELKLIFPEDAFSPVQSDIILLFQKVSCLSGVDVTIYRDEKA